MCDTSKFAANECPPRQDVELHRHHSSPPAGEGRERGHSFSPSPRLPRQGGGEAAAPLRAAGNHQIDINEQFRAALDLMENGASVFVTGKAGTGKSTLLSYFRATTKRKLVVLAPTGVAAVNVGGQTVHSFFGFRPDISPDRARRGALKMRKIKRDKLYKELECIVIDEVSMVRADLMECVDEFLRTVRGRKKVPFGGVQMILIGDLYQLPPVVSYTERHIFKERYPSEYFFDAPVFHETNLALIELERIYRQRDDRFIKILNGIRNNSIAADDLAHLNTRVDPHFTPARDEFYVYLATLNKKVDEINAAHLTRLPGRVRVYEGAAAGSFEERSIPADTRLELKQGAQVMLLNNDSEQRWVNGTIGEITHLHDDMIEVKLADGDTVDVEPYTWDLFRYTLNEKTKAIETDRVGQFTQLPVRLAWAVTIHKSQGKTFDRAVIDLSSGTFATGQAYVALSRLRSLEGMVLKAPLQKNHVLVDWRIIKFLTQYQYGLSEKKMSLNDKVAMIEDAIRDRKKLHITYLKNSDEKSRRTLEPKEVGTMQYKDTPFLGVRGVCLTRNDERVFRVDRILEMRVE